MFRAEEIGRLDRSYFNIILAEEYDVTLQSRIRGISGISIIRSIRGRGSVLFSISTGLPSRIISMGGPGVWGRRYGALWGMMCSR